ncbi:MAG: hypothetical protein ACFFEK_01790 [Candidatus Thorarchaeota archaeon]
MQWKKALIAIIVGIIVWMSDILFGWMSVNISGIWTIFIVMFIVGIIAGDFSGGFVAAFLTELLSVLLLALFPQVLVPGATITADNIFSMMWLVMGLSLSYHLRFPDEPVPWFEAIVIIAILIVLAPFVYAMALLFGLLGGGIGKIIYSRIFKEEKAPVPAYVPSQEPPPSQPPAPQQEPMEEQSTPEDESEEEQSTQEFDSSE